MKKLILILFIFMVTGCTSSKPNFYQPVPVQTNEITYPKFKQSVLLQPVLLPAEVSKPQIVTLGDENFEVKIDEFNRWASAPDKLFQRVINKNLSTYLPNATIENRSQIKKNCQYAVAIEIKNIGGRLEENAFLDASYFIKNQNGHLVKSGSLNESVAINGGYEDYIPAQSRLLGALSAQIAADLANLK